MATMKMPCAVGGGGGNIESISAQYVAMSTVGMQVSIADAHKAVMVEYNYTTHSIEQCLTLNGNAPDDYSMSNDKTYLIWVNTPANSVLSNTSGTWGIDMIYLD